MESPSEVARRELLSWPGVTVHDHRFGSLEFRVNEREMGHMHGEELADLPLPKNISKKLKEQGKVSPHHFIPQSGWITYHINGPADIGGLIELFRTQYERMTNDNKKSV